MPSPWIRPVPQGNRDEGRDVASEEVLLSAPRAIAASVLSARDICARAMGVSGVEHLCFQLEIGSFQKVERFFLGFARIAKVPAPQMPPSHRPKSFPNR